ncbi:MAG: gamma-glutamyl-gamma-aminobutyrate hydrolase family protein [Chloroflexia bacterium]
MTRKRPAVAVALSASEAANRSPRYAASQSYLDALEVAGAAPFGLAPIGEEALRTLFDLSAGVLLTGGGDVDPTHYGEKPIPALGHVSSQRDRAELALARWAVEENKPVLAICRGLQVLNVVCGGTLYQDLPSQVPGGLNHNESRDRGERGLATHSLEVQHDTRLAHAVGAGSHPVNTHHHQAIKALGAGLVVTGYSEDGIIESIEAESQSWIVGVQCHPEEMWNKHRWAAQLFEAFVHEIAAHAEPSKPNVVGALRTAES